MDRTELNEESRRPRVWQEVQIAWSGFGCANHIAAILGLKGGKRLQRIRNFGLDRRQQQEAFWASVAQMKKWQAKGA